MASYVAKMQADGRIYGECPNVGVVMAVDGAATFRATGAGSVTADGGTSFRGVAYFQSQAPSLPALNGKAIVYSWEVDAGRRCCLGALGSRLAWSKIIGRGAVTDENWLCWKAARQARHLPQDK